MKIANCKCGGGQPVILKNGEYNCERCGRYTFSLFSWNSLNTDQHGQQLYEKRLTFTEWDGDVEHLPEDGTRIFHSAPGEVSKKTSGLIGELKSSGAEPYVCFQWLLDNGPEVYELKICVIKGDLFAVVDE